MTSMNELGFAGTLLVALIGGGFGAAILAAAVAALPNEARTVVLAVLAVLAICLVPVACEAIGRAANPPTLIEPGEASGHPIMPLSSEVTPFVNHRDRTPRGRSHV